MTKIKKQRLIKVFNLYVILVCAIVGVGFVSGAEIYTFFVRFGNWFYVGVIVFFGLMFALTYKILGERNSQFVNKKNSIKTRKAISKNNSIITDEFYNKQLYNNNIKSENNHNCISATKSLKLQNKYKNKAKFTFLTKDRIKSFLLFYSSLMVASTMFSGLRVLVKQLFNYNYLWFMIIAVVLIVFVLYIGVHGLASFDYIVSIFLVLIISCLIYFSISGSGFVLAKDIHSLQSGVIGVQGASNFVGIILAISFAGLYVFMNIVQIEPAIKESRIAFDKKQRVMFAFLFSGLLSILLLVFGLFLKNNYSLTEYEMPFLELFFKKGYMFKYIFAFGLLFALMSSLLSALVGVKRGVERVVKDKFFVVVISVMLAFVLGFVRFSFFSHIMYPIIGIINFIIFVFM